MLMKILEHEREGQDEKLSGTHLHETFEVLGNRVTLVCVAALKRVTLCGVTVC